MTKTSLQTTRMGRQRVIRLGDEMDDALQRYADDTERTPSQVVRLALRRLFESASEQIIVRPAVALADDLPEMIEPPTRPRAQRTGESEMQKFMRIAREEQAEAERTGTGS